MPLGANALTNAHILHNYWNLVNAVGTGTGYLITQSSNSNSGFIDDDRDFAAPTTPLRVTASSGFHYGQCWHSDAADNCGYSIPAADS